MFWHRKLARHLSSTLNRGGTACVAQQRSKNTPPPPFRPTLADSFPLVLAIGGGAGGFWLAHTFKDVMALKNIQGSVLPATQIELAFTPILSCSCAGFTWLVASSPMRLAAVEAQLRLAHQAGRSVIWVLLLAGGAAGARALLAQIMLFAVHGIVACVGFAGKTMGFTHPLAWFGTLAMSIGQILVLTPLSLLSAIMMGTVGMGAGALVGVRFAQLVASPYIRLETALAALRGMTSVDCFLANVRIPLRNMLWWSPLLTLVAAFFWAPAMDDVHARQHSDRSGPDFTSKQKKFTEL